MAQWLETMPTRSRVLLGVGIVMLLAGAVFAWWALRPEQAVLFSRLNEADAAGIVAELKKQKVEYQLDGSGLADGGTTIRVPAERVHDIRLALMSSGTPIAGGVGFEIFDRQGLGATEQSQRVSFQRALQGELARTIGALDGVAQARVHLVLPESTLFRRDRQESRASVSLKLEPGVVLQGAQIFGIQRLVAAAVPGLDTGRVVVTDQHGLTVSAADALTVGGATGEGRLSMKREVEEYVARKVVALLDRAYGPGRAIVSVDATLNFDEVRRTVQELLPSTNGTVRRRRQTNGGAAPADSTLDVRQRARRTARYHRYRVRLRPQRRAGGRGSGWRHPALDRSHRAGRDGRPDAESHRRPGARRRRYRRRTRRSRRGARPRRIRRIGRGPRARGHAAGQSRRRGDCSGRARRGADRIRVEQCLAVGWRGPVVGAAVRHRIRGTRCEPPAPHIR